MTMAVPFCSLDVRCKEVGTRHYKCTALCWSHFGILVWIGFPFAYVFIPFSWWFFTFYWLQLKILSCLSFILYFFSIHCFVSLFVRIDNFACAQKHHTKKYVKSVCHFTFSAICFKSMCDFVYVQYEHHRIFYLMCNVIQCASEKHWIKEEWTRKT